LHFEKTFTPVNAWVKQDVSLLIGTHYAPPTILALLGQGNLTGGIDYIITLKTWPIGAGK
jgi:hypothetical protein